MSPPFGSTLKRPSARQLATYRADRIGDDTVGTLLASGFSFALCCRSCSRLVEWTPPELEARFGDRPGLKVAAIAVRLTCAGEDVCGSTDVAVFPHLYDQPWSWSGQPRP